MREIKFRAWDKNRKEMFFGSPVFHKGELDYFVEEIGGSCLSMEALDGPYYFEIMQSTGLLDKNGNEIYEGDIVRYRYSHIEGHREEIGKIEWRGFGFYNVDPKLSSCMSIIVKAANTYEVIGNIYSDPELLTK